VFDTVDQGEKKTSGDILAIMGERNPNVLAATARWIVAVSTGSLPSYAPTPAETERVIAIHPAMRRWVAKCSSSNKARKMFPSHLIAVVTVASERYGDSVVERFVEQVIDGVGLEKGSPALLLRERMLDQTAHKKAAPKILVAMAIKAISAHCNSREKLPFLRWKQDDAWPKL
jgi:hypothetical protein